MNKFTKKNIMVIMATVVAFAIIAIFVGDAFDDQRTSYEAKLDIEKKSQIKLERELNDKINLKSDIEILEMQANEAGESAENILAIINKAKLLIKDAQPKYEIQVLREACNLKQMERKAKGLEYDLDYCKDDKVLEEFRTKK